MSGLNGVYNQWDSRMQNSQGVYYRNMPCPYVEQNDSYMQQYAINPLSYATLQLNTTATIEPTNRIVEIEPPFDVYHEIKAGVKSPAVILDQLMTYLLSDEL
jgi:hypothetical protein